MALSQAPLPAAASVFLGDIHLSPEREDRGAQAFRAFLEALRLVEPPTALYILGDLFDAWLGEPSLRDPAHQEVLDALRALTRRGVEVTVFQGNRDFLLDGRFASRTGARVVEEGLAIELGDRRAYLLHGDGLLTTDRGHQCLRWVLRSAWGRTVAGLLPEAPVRRIARWLRSRSRGSRCRAPVVPPARELACLFRAGYDVVIAGHVHQEARRVLRVDGRACEYYTLGAWEERGSILVFDGKRLSFHPFPPPLPLPEGSLERSRSASS